MTAPDKPQDVTIQFEKGAPVKVISNGKETTGSLELFMALNEIGKIHGVGRIDIVEVSYLFYLVWSINRPWSDRLSVAKNIKSTDRLGIAISQSRLIAGLLVC